LDTLLDGLGEDDDTAAMGRKRKRKRSDEDDWLESKRKNAGDVEGPSTAVKGEESFLSSEEGDGGGVGALRDNEKNVESSRGLSDGTDLFGGSESYSSDMPWRLPQKNRENPYVAPATSPKALSVVKYIPPSLRKPSTSAETLLCLRRQMQGLLNRLSEGNLLSILGEVECLYRDNPRKHVTSTLVELLFSIVCNRMNLTDTFLVLHAGFVAALYRVVGIDFGASVVQRIVEEFDHYYSQKDGGLVTIEASSSGKITANLMALLAELYNFQVIGSNLIFDYIRMFLAGISELNTELLLKIIKSKLPLIVRVVLALLYCLSPAYPQI
jgi:nucleolar MIF4G domain-containing protein 1